MFMLVMIITEISLRIALQPSLSPVLASKVSKYLLWHTKGIMTSVNEAASYVRFKPNPAGERLNSFGFHSPEVELKKTKKKYRLVFLGGSTTFDDGPIKETYPYLVNELFLENGVTSDYINAGCPGYTSTESLIIYHLRIKAFLPDLVIFYNGRNDLITSGSNFYTDDITDLRRPPYYKPPPQVHQFFSRLSIGYAFLSEVIGYNSYRKNNWNYFIQHSKRQARLMGRPETMDKYMENIKAGRVFQVYKNNLEALSILTKSNDVKMLLVGFDFYAKKVSSVAFPKDIDLSDKEKKVLDDVIVQLNNILRETAYKFPNVYFIDLKGKINRDYFIDDCHLNFEGKQQKAKFITQFLFDIRDEIGL